MPFKWFAEPASETASTSHKRRFYAELKESLTRPIIETVGSSLGGAYAYAELVSRLADQAVGFDHHRLRERLFAEEEGALPVSAQFEAVESYTRGMARDAAKRLGRLEAVSLDVWNLVELAVDKVLGGDPAGIALVKRLVDADVADREANSVLVACVAVEALESQIKESVGLLAKMTFEADKKPTRKSRRKAVAQLSAAADLTKCLYCPLTNFCSLVVWLRETLEDHDIDPLKLYTDYSQRDDELARAPPDFDDRLDRLDRLDLDKTTRLKLRAASEDSAETSSTDDPTPIRPSSGSFWGEDAFNDFVEDVGPIFI
mmetsp:Transcript_11505/g.36565  ORF Transcript_11505/g.36565 Transcript_11505/m.36565 type:complete len:316 (-) Transcript_11505:451-1398(-)